MTTKNGFSESEKAIFSAFMKMEVSEEVATATAHAFTQYLLGYITDRGVAKLLLEHGAEKEFAIKVANAFRRFKFGEANSPTSGTDNSTPSPILTGSSAYQDNFVLSDDNDPLAKVIQAALEDAIGPRSKKDISAQADADVQDLPGNIGYTPSRELWRQKVTKEYLVPQDMVERLRHCKDTEISGWIQLCVGGTLAAVPAMVIAFVRMQSTLESTPLDILALIGDFAAIFIFTVFLILLIILALISKKNPVSVETICDEIEAFDTKVDADKNQNPKFP